MGRRSERGHTIERRGRPGLPRRPAYYILILVSDLQIAREAISGSAGAAAAPRRRPAYGTLVELLRRRAADQPDSQGFSFLADGEDEKDRLSYAELDRQSRAIGALLQRYAGAGDRALLVYPPGLEFVAAFFGCLYAGVVALPSYPPQPGRADRALDRFRAIVRDAEPSLALTTSSMLPLLERLFATVPECRTTRWLATDNLQGRTEEEFTEVPLDGQALAFLQYTSGSTADPRGVMLTHGNLLHNSELISRHFEHSPDSRGVIWLPPYHDMGLIGGILQPLYAGFPVVLLSPIAFLHRPLRWLEAISRYRATTSGGPNFAYDLCIRRITAEQRSKLDLSSWDVAFNGAESVAPETLDEFASTFGPCGFRREAFYPCYGLAEGTLLVSGGSKATAPVTCVVDGGAIVENRSVVPVSAGSPGARALVGCGRTPPDQHIVIVDPERRTRRPPDQVGEIWVAGPSVAQGYWNRRAETDETFRASLADTGEGPFLRTGDLGFLQDGELFVTGRIKDLIIIAGRNYYPQDIEQTVEQSHPALHGGCCVAFSVNGASGTERLIIAAEVGRRRRTVDADEIDRAIRRAVVERHDLGPDSVVLLKSGAIPKTSSGKIQRFACRSGFLSNSLDRLND